MRTVWAPYKLDELKGRRGLFQVQTKLADKLLAEGLIEDPAVGANKLTPITDDAPKRKAPPKKKEPKTKKVVEPEETKVTEPTQGKMIADDDLDVVAD
jgi:hypothetical protein